MSTIQAFFASCISPAALASLETALGLVLLNAVLGVLIAIKTRTFQFSKLSEFMQTYFIPYVGGLLVLALFSSYPEMTAVFFSIAAAIGVKLTADILKKISTLFGDLGITLQSPLKRKQKEDVVPAPQPVSPQTNMATNTPSADKTMPVESAPAQPAEQPAQPQPAVV